MISTGREGSATGSRCVAALYDSGPWCQWCREVEEGTPGSKCVPLLLCPCCSFQDSIKGMVGTLVYAVYSVAVNLGPAGHGVLPAM